MEIHTEGATEKRVREFIDQAEEILETDGKFHGEADRGALRDMVWQAKKA